MNAKKGNMGMVGQVAKKTPEKVVWIGGLEGKVEMGNGRRINCTP